MPLNQKTIPVSLGMSLDTKTDKFQMQTNFLVAENVFMRKTGKLEKSYGFANLASLDTDEAAITDMIQLANYNDELCLITADRLYSYSSSSDRWSDKEPCPIVATMSNPIIANSYEQSQVDLAIAADKAVYCWVDSRGGVYAQANDLISGAIIVRETRLSANGVRPRAMACNGYLFVFYYDSTLNDLMCSKLELGSFSTPVSVVTDIDTTTPYFDVVPVGAKMVVAYCNTSNDLAILYWLTSMVAGTALNGTPDPIVNTAEDPDLAINLCLGIQPSPTALPVFHVTWGNSSAGVKTMAYNSDLTVYKTSIVVDIETDVNQVGAVAYSTTLDVYFETDDGVNGYNNYVSNTPVNVTANTAGTTVVVQRAAALLSKPFMTSDTVSSIVVSYLSENALQDTYFVVNRNSEIETKILPQVAGGHPSVASFSVGVWDYEGRFNFANRRKTRNITAGETFYTLTGLNHTSIQYGSVDIGQAQQLGANLHIGGGYVKQYDGVSVVEHNFHLYPESPTVTTSASGTGVANGTYSYIVVWEWIDNQGQISRSTTSVPVSHTVSGGPKDVTVAIPTLRYTAKQGVRTAVIASVYRTTNAGLIYYKVSNDANPTYNSTTVDSITFTDSVSDATLIARQPLYTTGGLLDNSAAYTTNVIRSAKNRLFITSEDGNIIYYSKLWNQSDAVAFAAEFSIAVPRKGGVVTGFAELDDKLIVFKPSYIYALTGDGPNDAGGGDTFTITAVTSDTGTIEPDSIVEYKDGILFKSAKGIYKLGRDLSTEYIGAPVEDFNDLTITSAVVVADQNLIRFTTSNGSSLVYNYFFNQWFTQTNLAAYSAVNWLDTYTLLTTSNVVKTETVGEYANSGAVIKSKIQTGWMAFAGIQGYQRLYGIELLGEYLADTQLRVSILYNYVNSSTENWNVNLDEFGTTYGEEVYGDEEYYGGMETPQFQFRFQPELQKCQSFSLIIEDAFPTSTPSAGFTLSSLNLEVGILPGQFRLPPNRSISS